MYANYREVLPATPTPEPIPEPTAALAPTPNIPEPEPTEVPTPDEPQPARKKNPRGNAAIRQKPTAAFKFSPIRNLQAVFSNSAKNAR